ncbi:RDD family protein [Chitinophaga sp. G-6-1-13]|uniref:RDD family protein n=1 Tax=Chitinophaga fulva TaxID=2728842 RepID=A0A848GTR4_9BACT|nr:RDD family protein [Chitinophaga fulva]NML41447.1 RDD family protein [Chitinophaga fulva]
MESIDKSHSTDLLSDLQDPVIFEYASKGQRFANLFIDMIIIDLGMALLLNVIPGALLLLPFLIIWYIGYFVCMEAFAGGRTIGKMATNTRVVNLDKGPISIGQAFGRIFSRLVPFEAFSALFGVPWHDQWTNTTVIKNK